MTVSGWILETDRLALRRLKDDDLDSLFALYRDPDIRRYFPEGTLRSKRPATSSSGFSTSTPSVALLLGPGAPLLRGHAAQFLHRRQLSRVGALGAGVAACPIGHGQPISTLGGVGAHVLQEADLALRASHVAGGLQHVTRQNQEPRAALGALDADVAFHPSSVAATAP
jgi:hypothetical protein